MMKQNKYSKAPSRNKIADLNEELKDLPADLINNNLYEDIERKLGWITEEIENIGKVCDNRMQNSFICYQDFLDKEKEALDNQIQSSIEDLRHEIIRRKKETVPRYKSDYIAVTKKVYKIAKEASQSTNAFVKLDNKYKVLQEDDDFYTNQLVNAKELQSYLKYKINLLQQPPQNKKLSVKQSEISMIQQVSTMDSPSLTEVLPEKKILLTEVESVKHLSKWFDMNEKIIAKKIGFHQRQLTNKIVKYKRLAPINENTYMSQFKDLINEYLLINNRQRKPSPILPRINQRDQFVFQTEPSSIHSTKDSMCYDDLFQLSAREKREIAIKFLETREVKRLIYSLVYNGRTYY